MKLTRQKLEEWIKDEEKSIKDYQDYGYYDLADDEKRHLEFLLKLKQVVE